MQLRATARRIAAVGDIHCTRGSEGTLQPLFARAAEEADILLLLGDLTDYGQPEEAEVLVKELSAVARRLPIIAVLGNHDFESGREGDVREIVSAAGVLILDGDAHEIDGVGFAGTKGFAGGFGRRQLAPWGEKMIKDFVQESIDEALKLESALARLRTEHRVVLLHYSPIHATIEGEPEPIAPFLGSSRLEEPIDRYRATVVFHGHAHHGSPEGRTKGNVPVYNVALPLLKRSANGAAPIRLFELPAAVASNGS
ncbi:MAG: metallophosphoesterase [Thermoanaerobaculia bacterium]